MDNVSEILGAVPQELLIVLGGGLVTLLTQVSKKIRDKFNYDVDPKFLAAMIAIVGGIAYAVLKNTASDDLMESIVKFWALAFSGSVAIYELFKSLVKKGDGKVGVKENDLIYDLVETERKANLLKIDYEPFSLESIKLGKRDENDLRDHVSSLKERIQVEMYKLGGENIFKEGGI